MRDPVLQAFGAAIRARRLELRLSQEELGSRSGLHRTYIGGIERGERNVSLRNIVTLAQTLRLHPSSLLSTIPVAQGPLQ